MIEIVWSIIWFVLSLAGLIWAAGIAVRQLVKLAHIFQWSEFLVAFILMAFATTIPEFFVAINSALQNIQELALGNAIGSNIVDITLVAGVVILLGGKLPVKGVTLRKDIFALLGIALLPLLVGADGQITRLDGIIFLIVYGAYILFQFKFAKILKIPLDKIENNQENNHLLKTLVIFISSIAVLLLSSWMLVSSGEKLAQIIGIPQFLIGLFLVAFGTSIPELIFGIKALREKHSEMVLGDLLGAFAANVGLVFGMLVFNPVVIFSMAKFLVGAVALPLSIGIFLLLSATRKELKWNDALILLLFYAVFALIGWAIF